MTSQTLALRAVLGLVLALSSAHAATITVNSTADTFADPAVCTLRSAMAAAVTHEAVGACAAGEPGLDTIQIVLGFRCLTMPCVIELGGNLPQVSEDLVIDGGAYRPTVRAVGGQFPLIVVTQPVAVEIRNLGLQGGVSGAWGGAVFSPDGMTLTLSNVRFTSNVASGWGGALWARPNDRVTVVNSTFVDHRADAGGAIACAGGAVLQVSGSRFSGNWARGDGGAIHASHTTGGPSCDLTVTTSTFDGNTSGVGPLPGLSTGSGGAIFGNRAAAVIMDSTFTGNEAYGTAADGGAVRFQSANFEFGATLLANVTVSGNVAGRHGGGIATDGGTEIHNLTITDNTSDSDDDGSGDGGGLFVGSATGASCKVANTIVAGNFDSPGAPGPGAVHTDCSGSFDSLGFNVVGDASNCGGFDGVGDSVGSGAQPIDPLLGPLADNGGPTQTHALLPGSPALDGGDPAPPKNLVACWETDQRGMVRPRDGDGNGTPRCDAGAFEADDAPPSSTTTSTTTATTVTSTTTVAPGSTTTTTLPPGGCVLADLPDDSLAGVECALGAVRSALDTPPPPSCACRRCVLAPRVDRVAALVEAGAARTSARQCRRKLAKARRKGRSLEAKVAKLVARECLAPTDRATALAGATAELARRLTALSKGPYCTGE